jgi:hypothetical protein
MKLLIPLYELSYFPQVLTAAQQHPVAVIVNPNSGPGAKKDNDWLNAIQKLKKAGAQVFGYVDTQDWTEGSKQGLNRPASAIRNDCGKFQLWYGINTFFYDDWNEKTPVGSGMIPNLGASIANPGFDLKTECGTTMIWEDGQYEKSKTSKVKGQAVIAMDQKDYRPALALAKKRKIDFFYAVTGNGSTAYDKLPSYFDAMANDI